MLPRSESSLHGRAGRIFTLALLLALDSRAADAWSFPWSKPGGPALQGELVVPRKPSQSHQLELPSMPLPHAQAKGHSLSAQHPHPNTRRQQRKPSAGQAPQRPKQPRRTPSKPAKQRQPEAPAVSSKKTPSFNYVCKSKTAKDLLARALERISGSLFLTQERLDHFMGEDKFDQGFAAKYIFKNWQNYTAARGFDKYDRCAVVGNSGHLTLSQYGRMVDSFDAVIRTNQAPTQGYTKYVGRKTTFRLINRAMARRYQEAMDSRYKRLKQAKAGIDAAIKTIEAKEKADLEKASRKTSRRSATTREARPIRLGSTLAKLAGSSALKRLGVTEEMLAKVAGDRVVVDRLKAIMSGVGTNDVKVNREYFPMETNVTVVLVTEATSVRGEMESFIRSTRQLRPDVRVVVLTGKARKVVEEMLSVWTKRLMACWGIDTSAAGGSRATTGILATMVMMRQCKSVTLYGFGPPQKGIGAAPFHFYDGLMHRTYQSASKDVHNFSAELRFLMKLRDEEVLQICNEESHRLCGYTAKQVKQMQQVALNPTKANAEHPENGIVAEDEHDIGGMSARSSQDVVRASQVHATEDM